MKQADVIKYLKWAAIALAAYYAYTRIQAAGGLTNIFGGLLGSGAQPQGALPPAPGPVVTTTGQPIIGTHPTGGYPLVEDRTAGGVGLNDSRSSLLTSMHTDQAAAVSRASGGSTGRSSRGGGGVRGIDPSKGGWTQ